LLIQFRIYKVAYYYGECLEIKHGSSYLQATFKGYLYFIKQSLGRV